MWFKTVAFLSLLSVALAAVSESNRDAKKYFGELHRRFDRDTALRSEEYAGEALDGMYTECLSELSFQCLQRKVLNFINRMNRMEKFPLLGSYVSVVRTKDESEPEEESTARMANGDLDQLMDASIDRFFNNHVIRFKIPNSFATLNTLESRSFHDESTSLDFRFPYTEEVTGRKKGGGGGGGGGKMGKKMMMMMMMAMKAKLMMIGPLMMGIAGMMAMKALLMGVISLTISKIMIIKKLMKNKGHGGGGGGGWESSGGGSSGGWSSGGGGGWDRRNIQDKWDASSMAYRAYSTVENLF